ncbi:hypothetical protein GCM10007301_16870 [Azorhizobium oxalatiphilum]|uniref:FHA domain-containing protein n=2 Tax=Azorhizobium oxalatiphilum TaxID=980631 RepID=A0A917BUY8_9HYPH|nr:hypothetical protein GCM10007301_16870 [Azorhizobium oxalatiphilum]
MPGKVPPDQRARSLTEGTLRIGRDEDNDWVLEDDAKLISRHHCTLTARSGLFTIIDTSGNGVFINDSERALGRGNSAILSEGDLLHLGEISIQVSVASHTDDSDAFRAMLPPLGAPADLGIGGAEVPTREPPFAAPPPLVSPQPSVSPLSAPQRRGTLGFDLMRAPTPTVDRTPTYDPSWGGTRTPFGDLPSPTELPHGTPPDHLPVVEEALPPIRAASPQIPDDWDLDLPPRTPDIPLPRPSAIPPGPVPPMATPLRKTAPRPASPELPPDFDLDLGPDFAPAAPAPTPAVPAAPAPAPDAQGDRRLLLALIEALGVIESTVMPADRPRTLSGAPEEVLTRLSREDPDWVGLTLVSLSAEVSARLAQAPGTQAPGTRPAAAPVAPAPLSLSLPERVNRPVRDPGDSST